MTNIMMPEMDDYDKPWGDNLDSRAGGANLNADQNLYRAKQEVRNRLVS